MATKCGNCTSALLAVLSCVSLCVLIYFSTGVVPYVVYVALKGFTSLLFVLAGLLNANKAAKHLMATLLLYTVGDVVLCYNVEQGGVFFVIGHAIMIYDLGLLRRLCVSDVMVCAAVGSAVPSTLYLVGYQDLKQALSLGFYITILMLKVLAQNTKLSRAAAAIFLVSDFTLFQQTYMPKTEQLRWDIQSAIILSTYYVAANLYARVL